ncbi:MAG: NUDIX hydrolase [Candidatus Sulfotelmatobacter sp.]
MGPTAVTGGRPGQGKVTNRGNPANLHEYMVREISAGGVVIRRREGAWWMAAIEPAGDSGAKTALTRKKPVLALPKGLVDPGEKPLETALREVYEETGVKADLIAKLANIKYVYTRAWGDRQRVFKIVSFYLMMYRSGRINDISEEMRVEVARARWVPLNEAAVLLAYKGEKQMAEKALDYVIAHPELEAGS